MRSTDPQSPDLQRLDLADIRARDLLLPHCRLQPGELWRDPASGHVVICGDCTDRAVMERISRHATGAALAVHDPPYNLAVFERRSVDEYTAWCRQWIDFTRDLLADNSALYVWLGADQREHFQPLPQVMAMMAATDFAARSFITLRNQRGYGTQSNWMAIRQELLYYTLGKPAFDVQYTDIPKILRGYYKTVGGERTENLQRSAPTPSVPATSGWISSRCFIAWRRTSRAATPRNRSRRSRASWGHRRNRGRRSWISSPTPAPP